MALIHTFDICLVLVASLLLKRTNWNMGILYRDIHLGGGGRIVCFVLHHSHKITFPLLTNQERYYSVLENFKLTMRQIYLKLSLKSFTCLAWARGFTEVVSVLRSWGCAGLFFIREEKAHLYFYRHKYAPVVFTGPQDSIVGNFELP